MSKVFAMHVGVLNPGIKEEDYEKFLTEELYPAWQLPGVEVYVLKGDRGDKKGKYMLMFEFDSVETRDRYFPGGQQSEEFRQFMDSIGAVVRKWGTFGYLPGEHTDYVVVGK